MFRRFLDFLEIFNGIIYLINFIMDCNQEK